jgi:VanZ family protein
MAILAWLWSIFVLVACWLPARWFPDELKPTGPPPWWALPIAFDKIVHFGLFAVFAFLWAYRPGKPLRTNVPLLAGFAFIVLSELGQTIPYVGRTADLDDALADLVGLFAGLIVARLVSPASRREVVEAIMPEN